MATKLNSRRREMIMLTEKMTEALRWVWSFLCKEPQESNGTKHAEFELRKAGFFDKDADYGGMVGEAVMELMRVFSEQGHSGFSAPHVLSIFKKVALFEPLCPLTGDDDEWNEIGDCLFQNRRCSHVFKDSDGAYDIEGRVFRESNGVTYTSSESRVPVTFPYTPKREYVDVSDDQ